MRNLFFTYINFGSMARLGILLFVLLLDFVFRRNVYGRTDPLSFSLLSYSFLLVISDSFLKILQSFPPSSIALPSGFIAIAFVYLAVFFVIFFMVTGAHKGYQSAQEENIKTYLANLQRAHPDNAPAGVWDALETLGTTMIEPDAFEILPAKEKARVGYLKLVARVTGVPIDASVDQPKLLVGKGLTRFLARLGYVGSFTFGLASTLYFFSVR